MIVRTPALALSAMLLSAGAIAQQPLPPETAGPQLLHPMFQDHAVLQRDRPIKVYGETAPGAAVTVMLGSARGRSVAGSDGRWSVALPSMAAGGPYILSATSHDQTTTASDVFVGDVFFCAGQSNMAFTQRQAHGVADDARTATDGQVHQLTIPNYASATPRATFAHAVRWVVGSPDTVGNFSASCYYFVRELKKTVKVPVGMVVAAWGGARVRNWVSASALERLGLDSEE
jgi:sialate O-acetylesterase